MMRTDSGQLPIDRRKELAKVVQIVFGEFEVEVGRRTAPRWKAGRILKVVLFGSYARGSWVADPVGGYASDFDVLVVVNQREIAEDTAFWVAVHDRLLRELELGVDLRTPVNLIVHDLAGINRQLRRGRPFFVDIVRDGIALFEAPDHPFATPKPLSRESAMREARVYFEEWFGGAVGFLDTASYVRGEGRFKEAAFHLHQAVERLYHCTLLVLTLYSPKSHKLGFLRSQAERLEPTLIDAWPRGTRLAQRSFELLRRAYVDARYSPHYRVSEEELDWLFERTAVLRDLVQAACEEHLRPEPSGPAAG